MSNVGYVPTKKDLDQIVEFMIADIEREILWARFWEETKHKQLQDSLEKAGLYKGAGNYLVALGLLCYTEAFGRYKRRKNGEIDEPEYGFNDIFRLLGSDYNLLLKDRPNLYNELRGSFAHEYSPKRMNVVMFGTKGVQFNKNEWVLSLNEYSKDLFSFVNKNIELFYV